MQRSEIRGKLIWRNQVTNQFPKIRMRRLRAKPQLRALTQSTHLHVNDLIMPLFIKEGLTEKQAIKSMPGQFQLSLDDLAGEVDALSHTGIGSVILFGIPTNKDATGSSSTQDDGIVQQSIRRIKQANPDLLVIADACFCEYTDHGHCGVVHEINGRHDVDNDATLEHLGAQAVSFAHAGADLIAPSGMMDGMVQAIRSALDANDFSSLPIMSYSAKYASNFYGPFRDAAEGAPQFGDRRSYQMDPANQAEALREVELDLAEGADMVMVKPALSYLDVISQIKQHYPSVPLAAYQVSGEYAMIKAAAANGWLDDDKVMLESLLSIKRAGADCIISYASKDVAKLIK
jgi:porphobilinogen synthase